MAYQQVAFFVGNTLPSSKLNVLDANIDFVRSNHFGDVSSPVSGMWQVNTPSDNWRVSLYDASTYVGLMTIDTTANTYSLLSDGVTFSNVPSSKINDIAGVDVTPRAITTGKIGSLSNANFADDSITGLKLNDTCVKSLAANSVTLSRVDLSNASASGTIGQYSRISIDINPLSFYPDVKVNTYVWDVPADYFTVGLIHQQTSLTVDRESPVIGMANRGARSTGYQMAWAYIDD